MQSPQTDLKPIKKLSLQGCKSLKNHTSIDISPLTILAGANSSGKSSIMQGLLLWKQTLEAPYDPGTLLINGSHIQFTSIDQIMSVADTKQIIDSLTIGIEIDSRVFIEVTYRRQIKGRNFDIQKMVCGDGTNESEYRLDMTHDQILVAFSSNTRDIYHLLADHKTESSTLSMVRDRCFLIARSQNPNLPVFSLAGHMYPSILSVIHLPGLRGNPVREYPYTAVETIFPGTFEVYTASIIAQWQREGSDLLLTLNNQLAHLGLASYIVAEDSSDTQIELKVSRLRHSTRYPNGDVVNIADVGIGVSQTLPVLVALLVAQPGQLVYIEQPELHLHPRAQSALADILAAAARRGVYVVAETHSSLLLLGIQSLVAEGKMNPQHVALHWFTRDDNGFTTVESTKLDHTGAFGDWPEDFADVELEAHSRYLDAAEAQQFEQERGN